MIERKNEPPQVTAQLLNARNSNAANPRSRSRGLRHRIAQSKLSLLITVATGIWLGFTIAFAWALSSKSSALGSFSNPTDSIRILSIFSEGVSISLPALIACTSSIAMWAMASGDKGIPVSTWLSMSPATKLTSLPALFFWRSGGNWHRLWIIVRLIFLACVPIISILLRSFISTTTVHDPLYTYESSGGVGAFNASYLDLSDSNGLAITSNELSPIVLSVSSGQVLLSQGPGFESHFLVGGLSFMQPTDQIDGTDFPDADSVVAHQQLGVQIDLSSSVSEFVATTSDCKIWGIPSYGLNLCIAPAPGNKSALIAGVSSCFNDTECFHDLTWTETLEFTVTIAFSQRAADMVYSRTSLDITAFSNLSDPTPEIIAPSDLFHVFNNIFGPDYTSTGNLANGSSPIGYVLYNYINVFTDPPLNESRSINETDLRTLGGLVTLPILMSQATSGLGTDPDVDLSIPQVGLASNLYFAVDLSQSRLIAVIPKWVVIIYLAVSATIYVCCVVAMFLSFHADQPLVSSFEVLDLASKVVSVTEDDEHEVLDHESMLFGELLSRLKTGTDREIRKRLQTKRLFVQGGVPSSLVDGG